MKNISIYTHARAQIRWTHERATVAQSEKSTIGRVKSERKTENISGELISMPSSSQHLPKGIPSPELRAGNRNTLLPGEDHQEKPSALCWSPSLKKAVHNPSGC